MGRKGMRKGLLVVVSGPSGVGKGTLCRALRKRFPELHFSVSATTRPPRPGEKHGIDYYFLSKEEFETRVKNNGFLEWARVYNNYYGTPWGPVQEILQRGEDIILEIDMQGAEQVKDRYPEGVFIFLLPPSLEEQKRRILKRGTEDAESLAKRLGSVGEELKYLPRYDYVIVNDDITASVDKLAAIIIAEKCRVKRNREWLAKFSGNNGEGRE